MGAAAGIAVSWLVVGVVLLTNGDTGGAWICVFAFLAAAAVANNRGRRGRGLAAVVWWSLAGAIMVAADGGGWYALSVAAFLLPAASLGFGDFHLPGRIEWDLLDHNDDGGYVG